MKHLGRLNLWSVGPTKQDPPRWRISSVYVGSVRVGVGFRWRQRFYAFDWLGAAEKERR